MLCYACVQVGMYALKTAYRMLQLSITMNNTYIIIYNIYIYLSIIANVLQNVNMDALANLSQNVSAWLGNCCQWWLANSNPRQITEISGFCLFTSSCCFMETIAAACVSCLKNRVFHNEPLSATWRTPETSWPLHLPNAAPSPGPGRNIHHTENWSCLA